jgi:hypothetical protein
MKKALNVSLAFIMLLSVGCSNKAGILENSDDLDIIGYRDSITDLLNVPIANIDWGGIFNNPISIDSFRIEEVLGDHYFGVKSEFISEQGLISEEVLICSISRQEKPLTYPDDLPQAGIGAASSVALQNQYYFRWSSYGFDVNREYDMKLTRVNGKTGEVTIMDEIKLNTPFIYLCKIDDETFLSYYITRILTEKTENATLSVATIYSVDGTKREIIREIYENDVNGIDSEGIAIERFAMKDCEIYGIGRRLISGEFIFFLYNYCIDGNLIDSTELMEFQNIIGNSGIVEFFLVGDYIIFRDYDYLNYYICLIAEDGVKLLTNGFKDRIFCAVLNNYIFFIETNLDESTALVKENEVPLYIIEVESGNVTAINFPIPLENPYFVDFHSLSSSNILVTYCEGDLYDPQNLVHFILSRENLMTLLPF